LLRKGAVQKGVLDTIWCSEGGAPYKQSSAISRILKTILLAAKVPARYATYSIRHALITYLFDLGLSEVQVNAYTGHSNNSHTALNNYFHLDGKWLGRRIAAKEGVVSAQVEGWIAKDNGEYRREEGEEYDKQQEVDLAERSHTELLKMWD
jgi:hypothetical protein